MIWRVNTFTIVWAAIILLLTLVTGGGSANMKIPHLDKIIHVTMFGSLSLLLVIGLNKQNTSVVLKKNAAIIAIIVSALYGVLVECLQGVLPGRSFDINDMLANLTGAIIGFVVFLALYKIPAKEYQ